MTDLLVFSDDWGRHPSSCQHLVSRLLPERRTVWMNTVGTRLPALNLYTAVRGFEKIRSWASPAKSTPSGEENPLVVDPMMWPSFRSGAARRLNRHLLERAVRRAVDGEPPEVVVTTLPICADLIGRIGARRWVYYCVDDLSVWPGLDGKSLAEMELDLVKKVDDVIAVSHTLMDRFESMGRKAHLLTHGVDMEHWQTRGSEPLPSHFESLKRPWVVFWGVVDRRLDVDFLAELNRRMTHGTVLLVGPENEPDPRLDELERVKKIPPLAYDLLPSLAEEMACAVMPYRESEVTRVMQPLKLKEYLATGKPVVARRLPATTAWQDAADLVGDKDEFAERVLLRLQEGVPAAQEAARGRLDDEDWGKKAELFSAVLDGAG